MEAQLLSLRPPEPVKAPGIQLRVCLALALSLWAANIGLAKEDRPTRIPGKLLRQADRLIQERRIDEALALLGPASKTYPGDVELLLRLGNCYSLKEEYESARLSFVAGLKAHPDEPRLLHNLGLLFYKQKQYDRALSYFLRTVEIRAWHPNANFYIGLIYEDRGDREKARHYYIQELNHSPSNLKALERMRGLQDSPQEPETSRLTLPILLVVWLLALLGLALLLWKLRRTAAERPAARQAEKAGEP